MRHYVCGSVLGDKSFYACVCVVWHAVDDTFTPTLSLLSLEMYSCLCDLLLNACCLYT